MGMVVRTNTMALNAYRQLGMNSSAVTKSLEKLSSGFKINRAGDDAAGLAISERMKAQIKGLEAASSNSQDGISLVQTAEGALTEVHDMLNRMVELATKAANGVYTDSQRENYADEIDQLQQEIDRIAEATNFNSLPLLNGKMGLNDAAFTIGDEPVTAPGASITLAGLTSETETDKTKLHLNTPGHAQQGGAFAIDLADCEVDLSKATSNDMQIKFGIQGKEIELTIDCTDADNQKVWKGEELAQKLLDDATWMPTNNTPDANKTYAAVNFALYEVTRDGTRLTFTYAGEAAKGANATVDDVITDNMLQADQKADKTVTVTVGGTDAAKATISGSSYHGVLDITPMKKAEAGQRAGIEYNLATDGADL